jgi:phage gpG-like protein
MTPLSQKLTRRMESMKVREEDHIWAMKEQMTRMKMRAAQGLDVYGRPFPLKKDGTRSTLTSSGKLMNSFTVSTKVGPNGVASVVGIGGLAAKYAPFVNKTRKFLGASPEDRGEILRMVKESVVNRLRRTR